MQKKKWWSYWLHDCETSARLSETCLGSMSFDASLITYSEKFQHLSGEYNHLSGISSAYLERVHDSATQCKANAYKRKASTDHLEPDLPVFYLRNACDWQNKELARNVIHPQGHRQIGWVTGIESAMGPLLYSGLGFSLITACSVADIHSLTCWDHGQTCCMPFCLLANDKRPWMSPDEYEFPFWKWKWEVRKYQLEMMAVDFFH